MTTTRSIFSDPFPSVHTTLRAGPILDAAARLRLEARQQERQATVAAAVGDLGRAEALYTVARNLEARAAFIEKQSRWEVA